VSSLDQSGSLPRKYIRSIAGRNVMFDKEGFLCLLEIEKLFPGGISAR
jgi:hypothetical protein